MGMIEKTRQEVTHSTMNTDAVFPWTCEMGGEILLYVQSGGICFFFSLSSEWSGDSARAGRQAGR